MLTPLTTLALIGLFTFSPSPEKPQWLKDYGVARKQVEAQKKPLAVFFGSGKAGWNQSSQEGVLPKDVNHLLAEKYVCLYVDVNDQANRYLTAAFDIKQGHGLVISDSGGELQAFRHEGDLPDEDLTKYLRRYADPQRVIRMTETNSEVRRSYYPSDATQPSEGRVPSFSGGGRSC